MLLPVASSFVFMVDSYRFVFLFNY